MTVVPLAVTRINWAGYIEAYKNDAGIVPTKPLDREGIDTSELLAFPLIMANDARINYDVLQEGTRLEHLFASFAVIFFRDLSTTISNMTTLKCFANRVSDDTVTHVVSGTLDTWRRSICDNYHADCALGVFLKKVYNIFTVDLGAHVLFRGKYKV
jgi:hypothetical protein